MVGRVREPGEVHFKGVALDDPNVGGNARPERGDQIRIDLNRDNASHTLGQSPGQRAFPRAYFDDRVLAPNTGEVDDLSKDVGIREEMLAEMLLRHLRGLLGVHCLEQTSRTGFEPVSQP